MLPPPLQPPLHVLPPSFLLSAARKSTKHKSTKKINLMELLIIDAQQRQQINLWG